MAINTMKKALDKTLEWLTTAAVAILVIDVTWQIITRFVLNHPSSWTEEFATFLMMWVGLLGAAVAVNYKTHLGIDFFVLKLPGRWRSGVEMAVFLLVALFAVVIMVVGGLELVQKTLITNQVSPALNWKMGYVYLCLPVSGFFIVVYSLIHFGSAVSHLAKKESVRQ
jgi:TRAP-type C4-dicarboxylate transport system permease small subunit